MISFPTPSRRLALPAAIALAFAVSSVPAAPRAPNAYALHNLVSDGVVPADHTDPNLQNGWGVAFNPTGFVWVTDNHSGKSTLYDGLGNPQSLVVTIPPAVVGSSDPGSPDGIVYSGTSDFVVSNGTISGPSRFIFASEDGLISGWAPNVDLTNAIRVLATPDAVYKGLAIAASPTGMRLYATDFHNAHVDVFDSAFNKIMTTGAFVDATLPKHFAPFGIQAINGDIYVTYAKQDAAAHDNQPGGGVVDVFDSEGKFLHRGAAQVGLNAPWGVALAPADFGHYSNRLLVSNFGDGTITAYDQKTGNYLGHVRGADNRKLMVPGIWGIQFGNGVNSQPLNTLFFAAGPNEEVNGVYGSITVTTRASK